MEDILKDITHTSDGYPVKNLSFKVIDNIIVGLVKCPILGKDALHEGYISVVWNRYGKPQRHNKGREDLNLKLNY